MANKQEKILGKGVDENAHGPVKVLGEHWSSNIDCFQYDGVDLPENVIITKRLVLSFIARTLIHWDLCCHLQCQQRYYFSSCGKLD